MAKRCMIRREDQRTYLRNKFYHKRTALRAVINSKDATLEEKELAQAAISKLPKDSCKVRETKRCKITGRARGVYRIFGLCRNMIRIYAMLGYIPGLHKASW
jgi:small subunit ribosomal protein S14